MRLKGKTWSPPPDRVLAMPAHLHSPSKVRRSGQKPPLYLRKGDVMTLGIECLGEQRQDVIAFKPLTSRTEHTTERW